LTKNDQKWVQNWDRLFHDMGVLELPLRIRVKSKIKKEVWYQTWRTYKDVLTHLRGSPKSGNIVNSLVRTECIHAFYPTILP
jgi:hypothetical protein